MPEMGWPPPPPTTSYELTLAPSPARLGDVFLRLKAMLEAADLADATVLSIGEDGFAIVTRMESIAKTGAPTTEPGRFDFSEAGAFPSQFSLSYFVKTLLNRNPGRYRMFVITVTPRVAVGSPQNLPDWHGIQLQTRGATYLPPSLADLPLPNGTHVTALVYEFARQTANDNKPFFVRKSRLTAREHLVGAGLIQ